LERPCATLTGLIGIVAGYSVELQELYLYPITMQQAEAKLRGNEAPAQFEVEAKVLTLAKWVGVSLLSYGLILLAVVAVLLWAVCTGLERATDSLYEGLEEAADKAHVRATNLKEKLSR
jgi:hypothetical protein